MIPKYLVDFKLDELPRIKTDVVVVGAGIAGLFTAIKASEDHDVILIAKKTLLDSNTRYAQGGIAAVISETDSPELHCADTLHAGAGLCTKESVEVLVKEGPSRVRDLIQLGTQFDKENGKLALTKEGAHSKRRILHAHGDATGAEIVRALSEQVMQNDRIMIWDEHFAIDVITDDDEGCYGVLVQKLNGSRLFLQAKATVLCTGGAGQLYRYTTNPEVATGDGVAMAYRAGAVIQDMEFIQFHPTALCYPGAPRFLISEAVRGEGAVLRNMKGERFMERYHPLLELAPRDVVARAIVQEMEKTKSPFVYLDITHESERKIRSRFPTIYQFCLQYGLNLATDWIPVAPAAHYMMGGIKTDLNGESTIPRLFACGEVSSTGVHGANRLASNSLSEALVFGLRIVNKIKELDPLDRLPVISYDEHRVEVPIQPIVERKLKLQKVMLRYVGVERSLEGLEKAQVELSRQMPFFSSCLTKRDEFEFANLLTCARVTTECAIYRKESRGGHFRLDYPQPDDQHWLKHTTVRRQEQTGGNEYVGEKIASH